MSVLEQLAGKTVTAPAPPPPEEKLMDGGDWVDVIPYNAYNDPKGGYFLHWLWMKLQEDGLLKLYYPDAANDEKFFPTFVRMLSSETTSVILVVLKTPTTPDAPNGEVKDVIGFSTWDKMQLGLATVGHCGFIYRKDYWNRRTTIEAGHRIMRFWFDEAEPRLDTAIGLIAETNVLACRYVHALGWRKEGRIYKAQQYNGEQCDAVMWQYTREMYEARKGV